ncbi:unnamed protein product [Amoebophrya sp. A25]|nr:unnamed protein product [Amoebophrya sp. A25]|eukprot:GSA25T00025138001.1
MHSGDGLNAGAPFTLHIPPGAHPSLPLGGNALVANPFVLDSNATSSANSWWSTPAVGLPSGAPAPASSSISNSNESAKSTKGKGKSSGVSALAKDASTSSGMPMQTAQVKCFMVKGGAALPKGKSPWSYPFGLPEGGELVGTDMFGSYGPISLNTGLVKSKTASEAEALKAGKKGPAPSKSKAASKAAAAGGSFSDVPPPLTWEAVFSKEKGGKPSSVPKFLVSSFPPVSTVFAGLPPGSSTLGGSSSASASGANLLGNPFMASLVSPESSWPGSKAPADTSSATGKTSSKDKKKNDKKADGKSSKMEVIKNKSVSKFELFLHAKKEKDKKKCKPKSFTDTIMMEYENATLAHNIEQAHKDLQKLTYYIKGLSPSTTAAIEAAKQKVNTSSIGATSSKKAAATSSTSTAKSGGKKSTTSTSAGTSTATSSSSTSTFLAHPLATLEGLQNFVDQLSMPLPSGSSASSGSVSGIPGPYSFWSGGPSSLAGLTPKASSFWWQPGGKGAGSKGFGGWHSHKFASAMEKAFGGEPVSTMTKAERQKKIDAGLSTEMHEALAEKLRKIRKFLENKSEKFGRQVTADAVAAQTEAEFNDITGIPKAWCEEYEALYKLIVTQHATAKTKLASIVHQKLVAPALALLHGSQKELQKVNKAPAIQIWNQNCQLLKFRKKPWIAVGKHASCDIRFQKNENDWTSDFMATPEIECFLLWVDYLKSWVVFDLHIEGRKGIWTTSRSNGSRSLANSVPFSPALCMDGSLDPLDPLGDSGFGSSSSGKKGLSASTGLSSIYFSDSSSSAKAKFAKMLALEGGADFVPVSTSSTSTATGATSSSGASTGATSWGASTSLLTYKAPSSSNNTGGVAGAPSTTTTSTANQQLYKGGATKKATSSTSSTHKAASNALLGGASGKSVKGTTASTTSISSSKAPNNLESSLASKQNRATRRLLDFAQDEMFSLKLGSVHSSWNQKFLLCNMPPEEEENKEVVALEQDVQLQLQQDEEETELEKNNDVAARPDSSDSYKETKKAKTAGASNKTKTCSSTGGAGSGKTSSSTGVGDKNGNVIKTTSAINKTLSSSSSCLLEIDDENLCQTCMCAPVEVVTYPCQHKTLCIECFQIIATTSSASQILPKMSAQCPLCRANVSRSEPLVWKEAFEKKTGSLDP